MDAPKVKLHRTKEWSTDQPAHEILPSLPMRVALLGPSGSGKTQLGNVHDLVEKERE